MKLLPAAVVVIALGALAYYYEYELPYIDQAKAYVNNAEIITLEARLTPQEIMDAHRKELLGKDRVYLEPVQLFYPYLLLDVKYVDNHKSREGLILWSLVDGEMVINADTWEKTHGFKDAIQAGAGKQDFRILNALAKGDNTKEDLQKTLHLDAETLETQLESLRKKHLITIRGSTLKLHFQDPLIAVSPETKIKEGLVTKPLEKGEKVAKKFSKSQIQASAVSAFGQDFTIRHANEVFLPVYKLSVKNGDGSILHTYWNALNGKIIPFKP